MPRTQFLLRFITFGDSSRRPFDPLTQEVLEILCFPTRDVLTMNFRLVLDEQIEFRL